MSTISHTLQQNLGKMSRYVHAMEKRKKEPVAHMQRGIQILAIPLLQHLNHYVADV